MRGGRHLSRFSPPARDWNEPPKLGETGKGLGPVAEETGRLCSGFGRQGISPRPTEMAEFRVGELP